ncbi:MAG: DNA replication/repair protein RecF [Gammaproteobacteria bacterium]|nr:DNA replication/repair protein RecF [Gammaproteobacteria bacterium]
MARLCQLEISQLRNITAAKITPSPSLNLIVGNNAAGKTSFLEAIHILSTTRSFRTRNPKELIQHGKTLFRVTGRIFHEGREIPLGIEREGEKIQIKVAGQKIQKASDLAHWLPTQLIHPESYLMIAGGPKLRRKYLDWGLFHVEPSFLPAWQNYERALKQRNAALRQGAALKDLKIWDGVLSEGAQSINSVRKTYIKELQESLNKYTSHISGVSTVEITYLPGWDSGKTLVEVFDASYVRDRARGFTVSGPHRADFSIKLDGRRAEETASRGQQKMLVAALVLAQTELHLNKTQQSPVVLIDDLAAELDEGHRQYLLATLKSLGSQVFISCVEQASVSVEGWTGVKVFHVEQGVAVEQS